MMDRRYLSAHLFTPGSNDDNPPCCVSAERESMCGRPAGHPVHAVDRPEINRLAQALAERTWRNETPGLADMSRHSTHTYSYACAICCGDLHAIAAAVLDILGITPEGPHGALLADLADVLDVHAGLAAIVGPDADPAAEDGDR